MAIALALAAFHRSWWVVAATATACAVLALGLSPTGSRTAPART